MASKAKQQDASFETIDALAAEINKALGDTIVVRGSELKSHTIPRITSGSLALDVMLGGGWPVNKWSEIVGDPSSGKTVIALKTIAANQALNPAWEALWVASEPFVPDWAQRLGVDLDRIHVVETNIMEDAYEIIIKVLESRTVDCIVVDSLPALVPRDEDDKAMMEWQVGLAARINGKFFRKSGPAQRRSVIEDDRPCTGLIINQWREKIGVMYGDPRTTPGGKAKDFHFFIRVEVKRDEWLERNKERVGQTIKARTIKNKVAPVQRSAAVDFYFDSVPGFEAGTYDVAKDLFFTALYLDVIDQRASIYEFGEYKWKGKEQVLASIREDLGLQRDLRRKVLSHHRVSLAAPLTVDDPQPVSNRKRIIKK